MIHILARIFLHRNYNAITHVQSQAMQFISTDIHMIAIIIITVADSGGALGAEAPPFQSPLAFKCTHVILR